MHHPSAPFSPIWIRIGGAIGLPAPITGLNIRTPPIRSSTEAGGNAPDALAQGGGHVAQPPRAVAEHIGADLGAGDQIRQRPQLGSQFCHGGAAVQQLVRHLDGRKTGITGSRHLGAEAPAPGQRPVTHRPTSYDTQTRQYS